MTETIAPTAVTVIPFDLALDGQNRDHVDGDLLHAITVLERGALVPHSVVVIAS